MSILGKILAVLNVLAAVGFLALASMDWSKRQAWAYAAFRHQMVLHGLPVQEDEFNPKVPANLVVENLSDATLQDLFQNVGGNPVRTQQEEVERKKQEVLGHLGSLNEAERRKEAGELLVSLARTGAERMETIEKIADPNVPTADLVAALMARFDEALQPVRQAGTPEERQRDADERRRSIGGLLYNLSPNADWHRRVLVVVGLDSYVREADRQAAIWAATVPRVVNLLEREQTAFINQYLAMIQSRLETIDLVVRDLAVVLNEQKALKDKLAASVRGRSDQVNELQTRLAMLKKEVQTALVQQAELEQEIFKAQHELATAADQNVQLEKWIRYLEKLAEVEQ